MWFERGLLISLDGEKMAAFRWKNKLSRSSPAELWNLADLVTGFETGREAASMIWITSTSSVILCALQTQTPNNHVTPFPKT